MFIELDRPPPEPLIPEGAYWLLTPFAVALTTPVLVGLAVYLSGHSLAPGAAYAFELYREPLVGMVNALRATTSAFATLLPSTWAEAISSSPDDVALLSLGGGAYLGSWVAAGFQRALGPLLGGIAAFALAGFLGVSLIGLLFLLLLAFVAVQPEGWGLFFLGGLFENAQNTWAIFAPIVLAPLLATVFVVISALL